MKSEITLGVSGDVGSFSEQAALMYAKKHAIRVRLDYLIDMEGVLAAIEKRKIDMGIFPVVNLRGGLVRMAFDAMGKHQFQVIDEQWLEIHHCLLVKAGVEIKQIDEIISHSQALLQCRHYLKKNFDRAKFIEWQDTAHAAKALLQNKFASSTSAVIASEHAANIYGLHIIAKNIQDDNPNLTAFIVVKCYKD